MNFIIIVYAEVSFVLHEFSHLKMLGIWCEQNSTLEMAIGHPLAIAINVLNLPKNSIQFISISHAHQIIVSIIIVRLDRWMVFVEGMNCFALNLYSYIRCATSHEHNAVEKCPKKYKNNSMKKEKKRQNDYLNEFGHFSIDNKNALGICSASIVTHVKFWKKHDEQENDHLNNIKRDNVRPAFFQTIWTNLENNGKRRKLFEKIRHAHEQFSVLTKPEQHTHSKDISIYSMRLCVYACSNGKSLWMSAKQ